MQSLFTRGIDEQGNLRNEQTHKFKDSPIGRIPLEWEVCNLGGVSQFVTSGSRGWARYYCEEGAKFLRIGNLTRQHINLRFDDLVFVNPPASSEGKRTAVAEGDLLISITADLGIIGVIPPNFGEAYVNQHIALVRVYDNAIDTRFVGWYLTSHRGKTQFEQSNESGAKAGLNLPTSRKLLIPKPKNYKEQELIAQVIDSIALEDKCLHANLDKLYCLKNGLMQSLLTGRKPVTALLAAQEAVGV